MMAPYPIRVPPFLASDNCGFWRFASLNRLALTILRARIMKRSGFRGAVAFFCIFALQAIGLHAQQLATWNINSVDPSGAGIPQARVTLKSSSTSVTRSESSDGAGVVVIPGLSAGDYLLIVEAADFSAYRATLTLVVGQIADLRVVMGVNPLREQIDVRETALG